MSEAAPVDQTGLPASPAVLRFAVVIPTHNRRDSLLRVLARVRGEGRAAGVSPRLVVVADGSQDGTVEAVRREYPQARIVEGDGSWWWTRSANEGCRAALQDGAEAVLLLNDDVDLAAGYLSRLLQAVAVQPRALIGSLNLASDGRIFFSGAPSFRWWSGRLLRYHKFLAVPEEELHGVQPSVVLPGRGLWVPAAVFREIGFFCERLLIQYKADYDFVLRAHRRGFACLICWDAVVGVRLDSCGQGTTFSRRGVGSYLRAWFSPHSRNGLMPNFFYYLRHTPVWGWVLIPLIGACVAARHFRRFLRERRPAAG